MATQAAAFPGQGQTLLHDALLHPHTRAYRLTMRVVLALILLSVVVLVLETTEGVYDPYRPVFDVLEWLIVAAFTAEYLAHVYVAENKRQYILSWWGIIDLLAILPSYLALLDIRGLKTLRELRVLRVLRILKLMKVSAERYHQASERIGQRRYTFSLDIQIYLIALFTVVIISSTLAYHAEQNVLDTKFTSIPAAMWWAIVTVTTTGYGDLIPATLLGRLVAAGTMLSGLALFSLLTSVVGRALLTTLFGSAPEEQSGQQPPSTTVAMAGAAAVAAVAATASAAIARAAPPGTAERVAAPVAPVPTPEAPRPPDASVRGAMSDAFVRAGAGARIVAPESSVLSRLIHAAFTDHSTRLYKVVNASIIVLILASVLLIILESVESIHQEYATLFGVADYLVVGVFTLEYAAYIYLADNKRKYILSFWGFIDLVAILPTYVGLLAFIAPLNLTSVKIVRMLRVLRVLRVLKLSKLATSRAQETSQRRGGTFWLDLQIYLIALFTAVVISSTVVYYAEHEVPDTLFTDIPASMWWAIVTITTTGYGDMIPGTLAGRIIAGATMITGLALFGILTSVIGRAMLHSLFGSADEEADGALDPPSPPDGGGGGAGRTLIASPPTDRGAG